MASGTSSSRTYKLVTVNTAPERAFRLVGRVTEILKDRYQITHAANCDTIEQVKPTVEKIRPDILFCASMWTPEQSKEIQDIARSVRPDILTYAIPQGLQVEKGPDAVVEHLVEKVPQILDSSGS